MIGVANFMVLLILNHAQKKDLRNSSRWPLGNLGIYISAFTATALVLKYMNLI